MHVPAAPMHTYLIELGIRHSIFMLAFFLLLLLPHAVLTRSALLPLALVACGVVSSLVDLHAFKLVPTAFPTEQSRQAGQVFAIGVGVAVGFLALTAAPSPSA